MKASMQKALLIELLILFVVKESPVFCIPSAVKTSAKYVLLAGILYDLKNFCAAESDYMKEVTGYARSTKSRPISGVRRYDYIKMQGNYPAPHSMQAYMACVKSYVKNRIRIIGAVSMVPLLISVLLWDAIQEYRKKEGWRREVERRKQERRKAETRKKIRARLMNL